jgi:hypothetical protein
MSELRSMEQIVAARDATLAIYRDSSEDVRRAAENAVQYMLAELQANNGAPAPADFVEWFARNYPRDCVISDPSWHAPKIFRVARNCIEADRAEHIERTEKEAAKARALVPAVRAQEYVSDRPYSKGQVFFEFVVLDRAKLRDGDVLYLSPSEGKAA